MDGHLLVFPILIGSGAVLMGVLYLVFRRSLMWRICAFIIPTEFVAIICGGIAILTEASLAATIGLAVFGIASMVVGIRLTYGWVVRPLTRVIEQMKDIAERRDLRRLPAMDARSREVRQMQESFHLLTVSLRDIIGKIQENVGILATSSTTVSASASQGAVMASEQAALASQVSATVEEIRQTSKAAAESAENVVAMSEQAADSGRNGLASVDAAVATMDSIMKRVEAVATRIHELNDKMERIGQIIDSVEELAEQSNLLAVNASIEAARAGEQGQGFSAVASEVRNLAERSKNATNQVRTILSDIRSSTASVVVATEESHTQATQGGKAVDAVRAVISTLVDVMEQSTEQARQISGSTRQQAAGVQQIAAAMLQVAQGGTEAADSAQQLDRALAEMGEIGQRLKDMSTEYSV
jgi:methyl-accepting chemotaxis protein